MTATAPASAKVDGDVTTRKVWASAADAVADIPDGASLAVGGFGASGVPDLLVEALAAGDAGGFEVISNNCGTEDYGLGLLLAAGRIRRIIASFIGGNALFAKQYLSGELDVELTPQGTLSERLRCGGAGIPAFFTPAGVGTPVADGGIPVRYAPDGSVAVTSPPKEVRSFPGAWSDREYVLENAITADYALVHAHTGDTEGNLVFNLAARNFNPLAAMAGKVCIAQVENLVEAGEIDPAQVHLPGIFVDRIVHAGPQNKYIEKRTVRDAVED
ncbi:CoA transferase subunit A [Tomitella fengzijianii]|uniref:CoA transferase subunit A n=1 Tax=Tomitella fengzijianii TaxID=2597660 RepID=A0A516X2T0_9ACTN|nr:CoA transferase subunit A [Tomitella fengzijianii]QDQ97340.1 CoA transferase subunit A [Tomitella fengzijianii]